MQKCSEDFRRQLEGYGILLAEITYYLPDRPLILAPTLSHQMYDIAPKFPVLHSYIEFWMREIEGRLKSVRFDHQPLIGPSEYRSIDWEFAIN